MLDSFASLEQSASQPWDLVIIGGGITGAGILREAVRSGRSALLLEQGDFASGTSSRSSKLVHGGLRYLKAGQWQLTRHSVREREALLADAPGLVDPQPFAFPVFRGQRPGLGVTRFGLGLYDLIAGKRRSRRLAWEELQAWAPGLSTRDLEGVLCFEDAQTDDARLVLRLLQEACAHGGRAYNYSRVTGYQEEGGRITGVHWQQAGGPSGSLRAGTVINASGVWAQGLGGEQAPRLRPLRGSHLLLDAKRLNLPAALSFLHPDDRRPVFGYSWEGAALIGTTDLDHSDNLDREPQISDAEVDYLLKAAGFAWPGLKLGRADVIATYAGVRPVVDSGAERPSDESREAAMWQRDGLLSVTGGKLTTFRLTALDVLAALDGARPQRPAHIFDAPPALACPPACEAQTWQRLCGRYGGALETLLAGAQPGDFARIGSSHTVWAELRHAAAHEAVRHLDDLLLRRSRLGLVLPDACRAQMPRIRQVCQQALGWDDRRWGNEEGAWYRRWHSHYSLPARDG